MPDSKEAMHLKMLCEGELKDVLHAYEYIQGLVFAVSAAPEIPMPETWLIWAFDQRGQIASEQQADELTDTLMAMFQQQLRDMRDDNVDLPAALLYPEDHARNSPLSMWMTGLLAGHSQLENVWSDAWSNVGQKEPELLPNMRKNLKFCLGMFSSFADIPLAIQQAEEKGNPSLVEKLPTIYLSIPQALKQYVALSGQLVAFLPDQFETFVKQK